LSGSREQKIKRSPSRQIRPPQKPRRLLTWDARQEQGSSMKKGRLQLRSAQVTHREPAATTATKYEQTTRRAREFVDPNATQRDSRPEENLLPLTPRQLSAFQDIFKLFSCSPTGTVDMCSLKVVLHNVGIHLGPQEMCEALRLADLDGDGIVSFKDFLGVLTDNHRLAQCMGKGSRVCDPQGLQTLFLEVVFKLLRQGLVPSKSGQEVISYYSKKQRVLRLSPSWRGRARGQGRPVRSQPGLNYFCQAARISGLSSSELARSLHRLSRAGARSPYSQIPTLTGRTRPECRKRGRTRVSEVRLPKPYQPSRRKTQLNLRPLCQGVRQPGLVTQPLKQMRPAKLDPSLPTLVQKQPFSPSPACLQRSAMKSLYK
uniref:EF-hand domain-containing protein n=1 Tax=Castor canadensis TaxID=51338 RepID=A0A8C0X5Y3_CASCN